MSPITFTQQGIITQYELAKILIITSDGAIEVTVPLTDDDRRDMELHLRGKFSRSIALQVKSTTHLAHRFKAYQLSIFFSVPKNKLVTHPNFWYFFGFFDMTAMGFVNPVFIVPSEEVHKHAAPHLEGERWSFNFSASLDPASQDHWVPFRASTHQVGPRLLDILGSDQVRLGSQPLPGQIAALDGLVVAGPAAPTA